MEVKEYCTIDELTRIITIPDSLKTIGVMNDRNVNRLYFRVKRKVTDDFDLIGSTIYINFMNANNEKGQYVVSDLKDEGTYVTFSWLINSEVVSHKGEVKFIVCAKHLAGDYLTSEWNTTLANCTVLDGLEPDGTIAITPSEKDVVSQLIQNANNVYLAKEGIKKDVEKNKLDITQNAGEITQLKQDLNVYTKMNRTGKLYGVKKWKSNINPTSTCDKLYDNVGLVCEPSTDTVEGRDDYEDINIFKWQRVNYKRYDDGFAYPIAFEGDEDFNNVDNADVGNIYQTFYYNEIDKGDYAELIISDTPNHLLGLKPWEEAVRADGTVMPYYIMSAYDASLGSDGLLHSLPNRVIEANISHNRMISEFQKKGKGYWGAGSNRMTFAQIFSQIKYGTKDIQSVMAGCSGYSSQLKATIQSSNKAKTFPILKSQASLIEIGSRVSVGYGRVDSGNKINLDRGIATIHAYADQVKVLKIEDAGDGTNSLVYLDCEPFDTMPIDDAGSGLKLDITLTTMPWHSGSTDAVIKHHDGSLRSNNNSRMPCRIQGIEYFCGKYIIASDTVAMIQQDMSRDIYVAPRGVTHSKDDSVIKKTYTKVGTIPNAKAGGGADYWVGDVMINHGAWFPSAELATQNSYKDRLYFGGNATSGSREYLQGGSLWDGSVAGLARLDLWSWLGGAYWSYACAD